MNNKLHARITTIDGIKFRSGVEARRYQQLRLLLVNGDIKDLELQPEFPLIITNLKDGTTKQVGKYHADFRYYDTAKGQIIVEDVKGMMTEAAALRIKIVQVMYGIEVLLVTKNDI